ncbi:cell division protein DamX [Erwinia sp. HR93]|uniref:cell division protein DamX n=1 Tax=Erwinia sp. HR93 TaxID=3094840 RepID=UPI002ADECED4|nr:cell division protein DamX [Erwinia sp. HR93]MEA1063111.1 cell division protein DamX [Erwinia sp. HR93]
MDEFKPEDELKPDPSDRASGRARHGAYDDNEPRFNVDDMDIDADDPHAERMRAGSAEHDEAAGIAARRRASAPPRNPVSRQHMMMGLGILVLLLIIIGIGSALKGPAPSSGNDASHESNERNIDLSNGDNKGNDAGVNGGTIAGQQPINSGAQSGSGQDISLPPISSTPTQSQPQQQIDGQQRVEVPGDLNSALTGEQNAVNSSSASSQGSASGSMLPTQPATVAPVGGKSQPLSPDAAETPRHTTSPQRPARKQAVIEPPRRSERAHSTPAHTAPSRQAAPAANAAPEKVAPAKQAPEKAAPKANSVSASIGKGASGNVSALKAAPSGHYTLQLSSSSNYSNLNAWAKKENLQDYVIYQTVRNGKPWYVLVHGVYASKDEAKRAVSSLPADVQAKNPWTKPVSQVQSDLKQ